MNGIDDNGDDLVDCEDPQCSPAYHCVPDVPAGWSEIGYRAERNSNDNAIDCGKLELFHAFTDLISPTTGCQCSCSKPSNPVCEATPSSIWTSSNCTGYSYAVQPSTCHDFASAAQVGSVWVGSYSYQSGSCTVEVSGAPDPATWGRTVDICVAKERGSGCAAGHTCIPRAPAGAEANPCIRQIGTMECPSDYPTRHIYHSDVTDTRSCSAAQCSCSPSSGKCTPTVNLYTGQQCNNQQVNYPLGQSSGRCIATNYPAGTRIRSGYVAGNLETGSCASSGTGFLGTSSPKEPQTLCCR
jgi:hypothetical protein